MVYPKNHQFSITVFLFFDKTKGIIIGHFYFLPNWPLVEYMFKLSILYIENKSCFFPLNPLEVMKKPSRFFIEQWLLTQGLSPEQPLLPSDPEHQVALPVHAIKPLTFGKMSVLCMWFSSQTIIFIVNTVTSVLLSQQREVLRSDDHVPLHIPSIQERAERLASQFKDKPTQPKVNSQLQLALKTGFFLLTLKESYTNKGTIIF